MKPLLIFRHAAEDSAGTLEGILRRAELVFQYVDLFRDLPRHFDPSQLAGLVILGGAMNTDEEDQYPFLRPEVEWIRAAVEQPIPVLGICLGAQLLAKALGAEVRRNPVKEVGWYDVDLTDDGACDALMAGWQPRELVFQWHGDTFDLPAGARHLATGSECANQAFRVGDQAWGLQFHLEATQPIIDSWFNDPGCCERLSRLGYINPDEVRRQTPARLPAMHALGERTFGNFLSLCQQRANPL